MIDVTCAIIVKGQKILATKRARGMHLAGKWEFPGGKIEPGETATQCIVREIKEELNLNIRVLRKLPPVEYVYPDKSIRLIPFECEIVSGELKLKDHADYRWLPFKNLNKPDWAGADRKIAVSFILPSG